MPAKCKSSPSEPDGKALTMLLAVDIGNTNVVFALFEGREARTRWRLATDPRRTADEYAVWLMQLLSIHGIERTAIDRIIVSTVVPRGPLTRSTTSCVVQSLACSEPTRAIMSPRRMPDR